MLRTPKALGADIEGEVVPKGNTRAPRKSGRERGQGHYGRLARSDEHPPGVAISGSESGHAVQVRRRAKNTRVQAGQPLALQEVEAGPVDGREVEPDGTAGETQTEGSDQGGGTDLVKPTRARVPAPHKRWAHVWTGIEVDSRPGCRLLEHQGGGAQEEGRAD